MKTIVFGHQGVRQWENLTCCILFEDCFNPQVILKFSLLHNAEQWSDAEPARGQHAHTHKNSEKRTAMLQFPRHTQTHSLHTVVPRMKADIRPCLHQGEVGDTLSDFLNTTDLTTPRAEKLDSFSPYTHFSFFVVFFCPLCAHWHTHRIPDLSGVKWRAGERGWRAKGSERTVRRMHQANTWRDGSSDVSPYHAGRAQEGNISIQAIQWAEHKSRHILHLFAVCTHTAAKPVNTNIFSSVLLVEYCFYIVRSCNFLKVKSLATNACGTDFQGPDEDLAAVFGLMVQTCFPALIDCCHD